MSTAAFPFPPCREVTGHSGGAGIREQGKPTRSTLVLLLARGQTQVASSPRMPQQNGVVGQSRAGGEGFGELKGHA